MVDGVTLQPVNPSTLAVAAGNLRYQSGVGVLMAEAVL